MILSSYTIIYALLFKDSGGPLFDKVNNKLVGVVSWGYGKREIGADIFISVYLQGNLI